jgi:hypothetical protein
MDGAITLECLNLNLKMTEKSNMRGIAKVVESSNAGNVRARARGIWKSPTTPPGAMLSAKDDE